MISIKKAGQCYSISWVPDPKVLYICVNGKKVSSPATVWERDLVSSHREDGFDVFEVVNGILVED